MFVVQTAKRRIKIEKANRDNKSTNHGKLYQCIGTRENCEMHELPITYFAIRYSVVSEKFKYHLVKIVLHYAIFYGGNRMPKWARDYGLFNTICYVRRKLHRISHKILPIWPRCREDIVSLLGHIDLRAHTKDQ